MGGHDGGTYVSDLLFFNLGRCRFTLSSLPPCSIHFFPVSLSFEPRLIAGKPPSPRGYHIAILSDSRLFVFGGFNGQDVFDDVHVLDLAGCAYLAQVLPNRIPPLFSRVPDIT
jgi:Rab9 effector protein with kelch motifs